MSKKACKSCKIFVEGDKCPICSGNHFSDNWKGRVYVKDPERSEIARKLELKIKGEYSLKT